MTTEVTIFQLARRVRKEGFDVAYWAAGQNSDEIVTILADDDWASIEDIGRAELRDCLIDAYCNHIGYNQQTHDTLVADLVGRVAELVKELTEEELE